MNERKSLYVKPINEMQDSGVKMLEVGYVNNGEYKAIGRCSDVINFGFYEMDVMPKDLNVDVSPNGIVNIWSFNDELEWKRPILSNAQVIVKNKEDNQ